MAKVNRSALKRTRQAEKRRLRNKSFKTYVKTLTKKFKAETDPEKKRELLSLLYSTLDKGVSKGIFHKNTVARKKRKAAFLFNQFLKSLKGQSQTQVQAQA